MKKIFITGVSGVGKTTTAEALEKIGFHYIDFDRKEGKIAHWKNKITGEILHWQPGELDFFKNNKRICERETLVQLFNKYTGEDPIMVVGLVDNQSELLDLFDKVFLLHCDEEIFIKRIMDRTNNIFGKHESEQKMILRSYKDFEKKMIDNGAIEINTNKSTEEVVNEIIKNINS
jgi:dephospho-CoA kinase